MIIWINGAFGSGKSSVAEAISLRIQESFVYDPEQVGYFLWDNFPENLKRKGCFQSLPIWREFNYKILGHISNNYSGTIIVPMTVYNRQYYDEIIGSLVGDGITVKHFILSATRETVLARLLGRGESADSWAAQHIDLCIDAYDRDITEVKIVTENRSVDDIASEILELSGCAAAACRSSSRNN